MVEYTIDDIRGPTVAREMAQLKEFVLAKFNGAISDAEAAAAQAATDAANAVLNSIDSRVGALEGDMTTAQGDIVANANAILALDGSAVKIAGAQTITGIKNVPLEATGTASNQIASSQKVKNELDNYAPMLRTTGNQNYSGTKTNEHNAATTSSNATTPMIDKVNNIDMTQPSISNRYEFLPMIVDANGNIVGGIRVQLSSTDRVIFTIFTTKTDGTRANKQLAEYDRTNDTWI